MKILHTVESYYPSVGGMQEVVKQLSERMVALGHSVTVATKKNKDRKDKVINGVEIKEFDIDGNLVRGITGDADGYKEFLLNSNFDIVSNFAAQQWATDIALPILDKIKGKKVSVPTGYSALGWPNYADYFEKMKTWAKHYDANVFLSHNYRDINFALANGITKNYFITNGAAEEEFLPETKIDIRKKLGIPADAFLVLHVGSYTGIKGHAEAMSIYLKSKIKNGVLLLVGHGNEKFADSLKNSKRFKLLNWLNGSGKKYIITDLTREETVAAYKSANLFLFPSNIECSPIVLFECMASRLPFLTTDVGNSKEIIEWSKGGELLPTTLDNGGYSRAQIEPSARKLSEIWNKQKHRGELGSAGFSSWKNQFTWEIIAKKYIQLYHDLLNK
jgi:glycosyltransferase involved in cell wall biosynthesis